MCTNEQWLLTVAIINQSLGMYQVMARTNYNAAPHVAEHCATAAAGEVKVLLQHWQEGRLEQRLPEPAAGLCHQQPRHPRPTCSCKQRTRPSVLRL